MLMTRLLQLGPIVVLLAAAAVVDEPNATHREVEPLRLDIGPDGRIETMAMDAAGNLLVAVSWKSEADAVPKGDDDKRGSSDAPRGNRRKRSSDDKGPRAYAIQVVAPMSGDVVTTWPMADGLLPKAIYGCADGSVYVAGGGKLALFDRTGQRAKIVDVDEISKSRSLASGLCVCETEESRYVFLALGTGNSLRATEDIWRFDRDLASPRRIVEKQYGCCAHIDMEVMGGELLVAENSRHRVNRYSFDGELLGRWGKRDRNRIEGFAACCNPCNTDIGADGTVYTAESGVGRVKRFSSTGEYLGFVGWVDTTEFDRGSRLASQSCYIPVEVNEDASRIYVMDCRTHFIRVLEKRERHRRRI